MKPNTFLVIAIGIFSFSQTTLRAERIVKVPPIRVNSIHGGWGKVTGTIHISACSTSDTIIPSQTETREILVKNGGHSYFIELQNVGTSDLGFKIKLTSAWLFSMHSGGKAAAIPNATGRSLPDTTWESPLMTISANSGRVNVITGKCDSDGCALYHNDGTGTNTTIATSGTPPTVTGTCTAGTGQICLNLTSRLSLEVRVLSRTGGETNAGALIGSVSPYAHRCEGINDAFKIGQGVIPINGGKPF